MADLLFTTPRCEARFNGKCKGCARKHSVLAQCVGNGVRKVGVVDMPGPLFRVAGREELLVGLFETTLYVTCACGRLVTLGQVFGRFNASKKCNARCTEATGHQCECSCGGKNHGAAHG